MSEKSGFNFAERAMTGASILLLMALLSLAGCGHSGSAVRSAFSSLSNEELFETASQLSRDTQTADSAIICFTVLSDRLHNSPESQKIYNLQAKTLTNLGYLFSNFRSDYQTAYSYLSEALEISKREGFDSIIPYIILT